MQANDLSCYQLQVCQYGANKNNTAHPFSCGRPNGAILTLHSHSPLNFSIKYTGGEGGRYLCL